MRTVMLSMVGALALTACGGEPETPVVNEPAPEPAAAPEPAPAPDARVGTMNLMCGGESFRVAFLDTHAAIVSADGASTVELPVLPEGPTSEPGVTVYSDGMQQFAKSGQDLRRRRQGARMREDDIARQRNFVNRAM